MLENGFFNSNRQQTKEEQKKFLKDNLLRLQEILRKDESVLILQYIKEMAQNSCILDYMNIPADKLTQMLLVLRVRMDTYNQLKYIQELQPDAIDNAVEQLLSNQQYQQ